MRKLILLVAILCSGSASATDYAQCEAMQKTLERVKISMDENLRETMLEVVRDIHAQACGPKPNIDVLSKEYEAWLKCDMSAMTKENESRALAIAKVVLEPYQKKLNKINADYKKAGCI